MFKILFLILVVMCSTVFAQQTENNEQKEKPKSYIFLELGIANNTEMKAKMEEYSKELLKSDSATGYLISYGKAEQVSKRERQIRNGLDRHCHYDCRIVIVNGGESEELKTVFWVVPYGAEPPIP